MRLNGAFLVYLILGRVDLSRLKFVRDKSVLIAARGLSPSHSKQNTSQQRVKRF